MTTVSINPPRTPVTRGSNGIAAATLPNVCKMPGPPAPFVPTPLPNIGKSNNTPHGYSSSVVIEGESVAIEGAVFGSVGDIAAGGSGGGIMSQTVEGTTSFIGPGSFDVQIEGKRVHLLGDQMLNNCGPDGGPANSATMAGVLQNPFVVAARERNPGNIDYCGPGEHDESIQYPTVPKSEWHPLKRLEAMKETAKNAQDEFEVAAAAHNIADGSITHGRQLSRGLTPKEAKAGLHPDDQKVIAVCKTCGYRRELDQAPSRTATVEAKSTADALDGGRQKTNNRALVAKGHSVTYKSPPVLAQKAEWLRRQGFNHIEIVP